jgi:hypothetical protein
VLGFPFIFRGALDARAKSISLPMKVAAAEALAAVALEPITDEVQAYYPDERLELGPLYVIPKPFDSRLFTAVSFAVAEAAVKSGVAPAETDRENTGHHHLLINRAPFGEGEYGAEELELALPADDNHKHFGGGQTEVTLDLPPGSHTLQLVLGDKGHVPHDPPVVSEVITITVQ